MLRSRPAPRAASLRAVLLAALVGASAAPPAPAQGNDVSGAELPGAVPLPPEVAARLARAAAEDDDFGHETLATALVARLSAALPAPGEGDAPGAAEALEPLLAGAVRFAAAPAPAATGGALRAGVVALDAQQRAAAEAVPSAAAARRLALALADLGGAPPWKVKVLRAERLAADRLLMRVKLAPRPRVAGDERAHAFARLHLEWTSSAPEERREDPATWALDVVRVDERDVALARGGLEDAAAFVLAPSPAGRDQLVPSIPSLGLGLDATLGVGYLGHQGVAVGDVNGDGLDDLYLCQPGGLPDQLWLGRPDGTAVEVAAAVGLDLLDSSSSALFVDLDNDGDQDLVRATVSELLVHVNRGGGAFPVAFALPVSGATSLAAADVDLDRRVDLFVCTYGSPYTGGGLPLPFHDARNGTPNLLLANRSTAADQLAFEDVTEAAGMGGPDQRFSFTASFEDFDGDGDQDLYVANDFGRNHLWRNERLPEGGEGAFRFVDVAARLGVEDVASGMGVTWADFDRDGRSDLYVSNMFSSAGNRIGYDKRFHADAGEEALAAYHRHAAGNSLFLAREGGFESTGEASLGLWAWGGLAFELDGDGAPDLYVPNGFVTGTDPDDL